MKSVKFKLCYDSDEIEKLLVSFLRQTNGLDLSDDNVNEVISKTKDEIVDIINKTMKLRRKNE